MLIDMTFLSRAACQDYRPGGPAVLISIRGVGDPISNIEAGPVYQEVLRICFDDLAEEYPGSNRLLPWPDQSPHGGDLTMTVGPYKQIIPDLRHAQTMLAFWQRYHTDPAPFHGVVHCKAGIARSAAAALFASRLFGIPLNGDPQYANPRVLRLLEKARGLGPTVNWALATTVFVLSDLWDRVATK